MSMSMPLAAGEGDRHCRSGGGGGGSERESGSADTCRLAAGSADNCRAPAVSISISFISGSAAVTARGCGVQHPSGPWPRAFQLLGGQARHHAAGHVEGHSTSSRVVGQSTGQAESTGQAVCSRGRRYGYLHAAGYSDRGVEVAQGGTPTESVEVAPGTLPHGTLDDSSHIRKEVVGPRVANPVCCTFAGSPPDSKWGA